VSATDYSRLFEEAVRAGQNRDYRTAVDLFTRIVSHTDQYPQSLLYLGRSYHALGQYNRAVLALEFYIKIFPKSAPGRFFLGRTYLALGYYESAIHNLRYTADHEPNFLPAHSFLGLAYLKIRKPELAVRYFENALQIDPDNQRVFTGYLNALLVKGIRCFHKRRYEEAEEIFRFILENRNDSILAHLYLGRIYRLTGQDSKSLGHYDTAARLSPDDPIFPMLKAFVYLRSGDVKSAFGELDRVKDLFGGSPFTKDPDILLKLITITLFREKQYRNAISYGRQVLKSNYRDDDVHAIIAESYLNLEEYEKARNHFMRSIEVDRNRLDYHHGLALSLWYLKDYEGFRRATNRIRRIAPEDRMTRYFEGLHSSQSGDASEDSLRTLQVLIRELGPDANLMYALGRQYLELGLPELSEGWFLRTLKLDNQHRESYLALIRAYELLGDIEKQQDTLSTYTALFPTDRKKREELIQKLMASDSYEEASRQITAILARHPKNKLMKQKLAFCYVRTKNFAEAGVIYRDLLKDEPRSIPLLHSLVSCLDKSGNPDQAIELLSRADHFMRDNPSILLPLGVLLSRNEHFERAKEVFRKVIAIVPGDWRAYQNLAVLYGRTGQKSFAEKFYETAQKYRS
jgi:tetratricopeptide (TPR) repeat protein